MQFNLRIIILFMLLSSCSYGQNLTGTWEGRGGSEYLKLVIVQFGDSCFGYTYDTGAGFCKANFGGTYNSSESRLKGKGLSFIDRTMMHVLCRYDLTYSKRGDMEYLNGKVMPKSFLLSLGIAHPAWLKKTSNSIDTTRLIATKVAFYQNDQPIISKTEIKIDSVIVESKATQDIVAIPPTMEAIKQSRTSKLLQTIETGADSISLILFDNGEIDGDTVTVFYNGKIIISSLGLSERYFELKVPLIKSVSPNTIELMANNLGSIPPNTAHMHIIADKVKYELRVSSDFNENAKINILYKKE